MKETWYSKWIAPLIPHMRFGRDRYGSGWRFWGQMTWLRTHFQFEVSR